MDLTDETGIKLPRGDMDSLNLEDLAGQMHELLWNGSGEIIMQILNGLVKGTPLPLNHLCETLKMSLDELKISLLSLPYIEYDETGNILAAGLSITPTPFKYSVNGKDLYTWCALESLMYPKLLGHTAIINTHCFVSNNKIKLHITPEKILTVFPKSAVVSMIKPEFFHTCCEVKTTFCNLVNFFNSEYEAKKWIKQHPQTTIMSIDEAFYLGRILARKRLV